MVGGELFKKRFCKTFVKILLQKYNVKIRQFGWKSSPVLWDMA